MSYICWLLLAAQTQTQTREGGVFDHPLVFTFNFQIVFTDFASFLISLFAIWMAAKPKSQKMSFGWHRAEVLGATVSVLMIWLVTGILVYMAILR